MCDGKAVVYVALVMGDSPSVEARRTWSTLAILAGVAALACVSSSSIEARGGASAYAPANERRGGSLRYYEGTKTREDAYQEMFTYCGGNYEIVNERDVNRGMTTQYNRYSYNTTTTTMIEHVIDFRCLDQARSASSAVRLTGDEWRLSRDYVVQHSGCPSANVEHEVASPTPGAKGYAVSACGQRWLCSAGNGVAVCGVDGAGQAVGAPPPAQPYQPYQPYQPVPQPQPDAPPPSL